MDLNAQQLELEHMYDAATPHRVEDFLLLDAHLARQLSDTPGESPIDEQLLVHEHEDGLDMSLYLRRRVMGRLRADDPSLALHSGNLNDYWLAVEGISHFLHLVWHAGHARRITRLELELLAEIDKFVTATTRMREQTGACHSRPLQRMLFETIRFRDDLSADCRHRYYEANRLAARYCRTLKRRFCMDAGDPALSRELRRFQRMPKADKLHYIEAMA